MRKLTPISLIVLAALAVAPASAQAARSCSVFKGKTLVSNSQMLIVKQSRPYGSRLVGCDRRNGKGRLLGQNTSRRPLPGNVNRNDKLVAGAGHFAAVRRSSTNGFGGGESTIVVDIRTARYYVIAATSFSDAVPPNAPTTTVARTVRLASDGRSAAFVAIGNATPNFQQTSTQVRGFSPAGRYNILATAPPKTLSSLALRRGIAQLVAGRHRQVGAGPVGPTT